MNPWAWWLVSAAVLVVAEILTTSLVFAMIATGAAAGAIVERMARVHAVQQAYDDMDFTLCKVRRVVF